MIKFFEQAIKDVERVLANQIRQQVEVDEIRDLSRIFFQGVQMELEMKLGRKRAVN